ncbi:hypothetical protein SAMN05216522_1062 [Rosenbergiella nectarea]|uniref:Uncharacterized protein n=2 Tax=Rosenbergiella TaxID=1356488 RepID=A0A1H9IDM1_9GAMM|nr:hypothetical protein [Rosenbergiella gaditana]MBT0723632.1 hypothetical protein [Rosenbergiella gaditana]SEQ72638.1 hypothetical protein SAMN05216522_1062 [Rosenbergiella nectarea]
MLKWIKRILGFLVLSVVMFFVIGKLISLLWPNVTDYLASWLNTVGVEETTDLLFDFTFWIALIISMLICVLCIRRNS